MVGSSAAVARLQMNQLPDKWRWLDRWTLERYDMPIVVI
jgi:hypothetical protein